jgi:aspartate kinase
MFWEHVNGVLAKYGAIPAATATTEYHYAVVLDAGTDTGGISRDLEEVAQVSVLDRQGILCIVGSNLQRAPHILGRIFSVLDVSGFSMISFGASGSSLTIILDDEVLQDAVRRVHKEFFESAPDGEIFETLKGPALLA